MAARLTRCDPEGI